jgi:flagellar protein FliO/FliZ
MLIKLTIYISSLLFSLEVQAADVVRPAFTPPPSSSVSAGSLLQVILSLLLVLAAIVLVAWVLKRINLPQNSASGALKVVSGVAVGQRERIVLVEINDTWLVVGVAPGQVTALHTMPKNQLPLSKEATLPEADNKFKNWLKIVMDRRNAA